MSKISFNFNDYVSLAVMLLMVVALVSGQSGASAEAAEAPNASIPVSIDDHDSNIALGAYLSGEVLKISIDIVGDIPHFRGEDE